MKRVYRWLVPSLTAVAVAVAFTGAARAEVKANTLEVGPFLNYTSWDSNVTLKDSLGWGAWVGWNFKGGHEVEGTFWWTSPDIDLPGGPSIDVRTWAVDYVYNFADIKPLTPFVRAGLGSTNFSFRGNNEDDSTIFVGGGGRYFFQKNFDLRFGLDWVRVNTDPDTTDNFVLNVGVSWMLLGGK